MRIIYIAAGAAGSYCGACARDTALAHALTSRGHDLQFLSLYTPVKSDTEPPGPCRIFYGGVSVYLEQHSWLFRHMPGFLHRLLDNEWVLDFVERFAIDTRPEGLGEMTVSVLSGRMGRQRGELEKLIRFLRDGPPPDVVNITNSLLSAIAPAVKETLAVPVVCNLQGEDAFVDRIGEPWRQEALRLIRSHAASVDTFVAPSEGYADTMAGWLGVDRSRIRVIRPGVDLDVYRAKEPLPTDTFRIGFLSRVTPSKGIDLLCEAFRGMERERPGRAALAVAGEVSGGDQEFWDRQVRLLTEAGLSDRFDYAGSPDLEGKLRFLNRCSVFSVPSAVHERQAVACLEAMAVGRPVVLPDRGIYSEIVSLTGGGLLVRPDDAVALARGLAELRDDRRCLERLALQAAEGIATHFSSEVMLARTIDLYEALLRA